MKPVDLLTNAQVLLSSAGGRPTEVSLRRATSAAYYALFHCVARECADLLIGGANSSRSKPAWRQVYRALEHNFAKSQCADKGVIHRFPKPIEDFANHFVAMQEKRHKADYDPFHRIYKSEVAVDIALTKQAMEQFKRTPKRDRQAFCALVLFKKR